MPFRRGSALAKGAPGDGPNAGWPTLLAQLMPLSTPAVLHRLHAFFGLGSGRPELDYAEVSSSRDKLLFKLVDAYERAAGLRPLVDASEAQRSRDAAACTAHCPINSARCRREVLCEGVLLPEELRGSLLEALRAAQWPEESDRPKVASSSYLVLERPPSGAPSESAGAAGSSCGLGWGSGW